MGNLTRQTDARGQITNLIYDGLYCLTGNIYPGKENENVSYPYDANGYIGYRTSMTDASGETHWTYDARGRMTSENKTIYGQSFITRWQYDSGIG